MIRKIVDPKDFVSTKSVTCLEKEFTSPIIKNYRKVFNNRHLDLAANQPVVGSINTKVYDDGLIVIIDPVSQKISYSFNNGKDWVKYPIPNTIDDFCRVGKESFIFHNIFDNTLYFTYNMFGDFKPIPESINLDQILLSSAPNIGYFASNSSGGGTYKVNNADTPNMSVSQIYEKGIVVEYNGVAYFAQLWFGQITIWEIYEYQLLDRHVLIDQNLICNPSNNYDITSLGVFNDNNGNLKFVFTLFSQNVHDGYICVSNSKNDGSANTFNSSMYFANILYFSAHLEGTRLFLIYVDGTQYMMYQTIVGILDYNISAGFFTPYGTSEMSPFRGVSQLNGMCTAYIQLNTLLVDSEPFIVNSNAYAYFDDKVSVSIKSFSYSNGYLYVSNNTSTVKISADIRYGMIFLDQYFHPGDIAAGRLIDILITKSGVSLLTLDKSTAVSINPADGSFSKIYYPTGSQLNGSPFAKIVTYFPDNIEAYELMTYDLTQLPYNGSFDVANNNASLHQAVALGETAVSSANKFMFIKAVFINTGNYHSHIPKYKALPYLFFSDYNIASNQYGAGGPIGFQEVEWGAFFNTFIFGACDIDGSNTLIFTAKERNANLGGIPSDQSKFNTYLSMPPNNVITVSKYITNMYWDSNITYRPGSYCNWNNITYIATSNVTPNINNQPDQGTGAWVAVTEGVYSPGNSSTLIKLFDIHFPENTPDIENCKMVKISYLNGQIVVYFNNRHPVLINNDLNGYTDLIIPGYEDYYVNGIEYVQNQYIISVGKVKPICALANTSFNDNDRVVSQIVLVGKSLRYLTQVISDGRITGLRYDIFRDLIYIVHLDKLEVYDNMLNLIKSYDVSLNLKYSTNITIDSSSSNNIDHGKFKRALISSGYLNQYPDTSTSLVIESIINNRFNGDDVSCIINEYAGSQLVSTNEVCVNYDECSVFNIDDVADNYRFYMYGKYGLYTYDQPANVNFKYFQNKDYYGILSIDMKVLGVSSKNSPSDIVYNPLDQTQIITGSETIMIYNDYIAILSSDVGYLSIYKIDSILQISVCRLNVSVGPNSTPTSFIMDDLGNIFLPNSSNINDKIVTFNVNSPGGPVNFLPIVANSCGLDNNFQYDIIKYRNKIYGSFGGNSNANFYGTQNGDYYNFIGIIEGLSSDSTTIIVNTIPNTIKKFTGGCYRMNIDNDKIIINDGIVNMEFDIDDILGANDQMVVSGMMSENSITYKKINDSSPLSIDTISLNNSKNRNFDTPGKSFVYEVFERFMKTSGIIRDYNTDRIYNVKELLDTFIMISDTYTDRKRIDIGSKANYNPINLIITDNYTINVDTSVFTKVSAFIKQYDPDTLNSLFGFIISEKMV